MDTSSEPVAQPETGKTNLSPPRPAKKSTKTIGLAIIVLLLAALAALYFVQNNKIRELTKQKKAAETQSDSLQAQLSAANSVTQKAIPTPTTTTAAAASDSVLLPGGADATTERVTVSALYIYKDNMKEIWIEYGESPTALNKATKHTSQELALGNTEGFRPYDFFIQSSELKMGARYYYRAAAIYSDKTVYSGVSSFVTKK